MSRTSYMKVYYRKYKAKYRIRERQRAETRRLVVAALKSGPCLDCEHTFPPCAMDFDHVRGKKLFDIGHSHDRCIPLEKLMKEVAKCDLVCANCHRIRTESRNRKAH